MATRRLGRLREHLLQRAAGDPPAANLARPDHKLRRAHVVAVEAVSGPDAVPSLAVAVSVRGRLLWEEAFGWAELGVRRATPDTLYSLASISKPITATALMVLVDRGLVDLDAPINRYLRPSAPVIGRAGSADGVTVRRVANHSSGLPLHFNMFYQQELDEGLRPPIDKTIRQYAQTVSRPGEGWQYSNLGYALLQHVVSRTASKAANAHTTFEDFLEREVLRPLGMAHTTFGNVKAVQAKDPALARQMAARYPEQSVSGGLAPLEDYDSDHPGAAAVWSSVRDVLRFGEFHCAGEHHTMACCAACPTWLTLPATLPGSPNRVPCGARSHSACARQCSCKMRPGPLIKALSS